MFKKFLIIGSIISAGSILIAYKKIAKKRNDDFLMWCYENYQEQMRWYEEYEEQRKYYETYYETQFKNRGH